MIVRRLSTDALFLVLFCLVLGTLVLAQTSVRAFSSAGGRSGVVSAPPACLEGVACTAQHGLAKTRVAVVRV